MFVHSVEGCNAERPNIPSLLHPRSCWRGGRNVELDIRQRTWAKSFSEVKASVKSDCFERIYSLLKSTSIYGKGKTHEASKAFEYTEAEYTGCS